MRIDLNSDLGESFGPWQMGDDAAVLDIVTSANVACGGHAGDPATMVETLKLARERGVVVGAHPGFADATQIGALMGAAALAGAVIRYVKPHGALHNWAADERPVADAIVRAIKAVSPDLALLATSGTELEHAGRDIGLATFSEIFADRGYLATGRLVPRSRAGAMIHDPAAATSRLVEFLSTGLMPTIEGTAIPLAAQSICVHGDSPGAVAMARNVRAGLEAAGVTVAPFLPAAGDRG
jgi:UPF0271 protein